MAKTIFEQIGGTYTQVGDYYLPNLKLPEEEKQANIGVWGMRHKRFLRKNHRLLYANLMTSGKLVAYLDDIEQQATAMFLRLVKELAEKENVTEELKAENQMLWVQKMTNIRNRATEIVTFSFFPNLAIKVLLIPAASPSSFFFIFLSIRSFHNLL